jgi:PTH1 family peptidyl-tRNA hydrolase
MKIICGLGNPGQKYDHTRHNIGFELIDSLREKYTFPAFTLENKFTAEISTGEIEGKKIILVKPQTFMNLSGEALQKILAFYKLTPLDILVIHDDLDIPFGKYKLATDSSSAGHNGVQNIIDQIGTKQFKRIRIGIGEASDDAVVCRMEAHDYVLERFKDEELTKLIKIKENILEEIEKILQSGE